MIKLINENRKQIIRKWVAKQVEGEKGEILDSGCGINGSWDYGSVKHGHVLGIDKIVGGDAEHLEFSKNLFDVVVFMGVIQYLDNLIKALQECYRVLKPNGKLIISTINKNSIVNKINGFNAEKFIVYPNYIDGCLSEIGFKIISRKYLDFWFIPKKWRMTYALVCRKEK